MEEVIRDTLTSHAPGAVDQAVNRMPCVLPHGMSIVSLMIG
jgi:hypothetical protein